MRFLGEVFSIHANESSRLNEKYKKRESAKAIIYDEDLNIGYIHVGKGNYFTIPGGGIDAGENVTQALHRECLEEAG